MLPIPCCCRSGSTLNGPKCQWGCFGFSFAQTGNHLKTFIMLPPSTLSIEGSNGNIFNGGSWQLGHSTIPITPTICPSSFATNVCSGNRSKATLENPSFRCEFEPKAAMFKGLVTYACPIMEDTAGISPGRIGSIVIFMSLIS